MSILLQFPWNEQTYVVAGEIAHRYKTKHTYKKYFGYFYIALAFFGAIAGAQKGDYSMLWVGTIGTVYWYLLRGMISRARFKQNFKKEPIKHGIMKIFISSKVINVSGNKIPWDSISKVILHKNGFLLERPEGYPYLPATAFANDQEVEEFLKIVEDNDVEMIQMI